MLEKMSDFFEARLEGYDEHMLNNIESAREFYPFTAKQLPSFSNCHILDLGCGTGLELEEYYLLNPLAKVTGIDLSQGMLDVLKRKFVDKDMTLICGSYFDVDFGEEVFDGAVSVESLHHFTKEEKVPLYRKLHSSLKCDGYFILTDYFADNDHDDNRSQEPCVLFEGLTGCGVLRDRGSEDCRDDYHRDGDCDHCADDLCHVCHNFSPPEIDSFFAVCVTVHRYDDETKDRDNNSYSDKRGPGRALISIV